MLALAAGAAFGCRSGVRSGCVPRVRGLSGFSVCSYLAFETFGGAIGFPLTLLGAATLIVAGGMRMTHHTPSAPIAALLVDRERG